MASSPEPGVIDLPGIFEATVLELLSAVEQGRILHRTKNIRDSGHPFEERLRQVFREHLPIVYGVKHGYLFDADSKCTPQIDAVVLDEAEAHEAIRTSEGASYVPFPCARVVAEVKNSARGALQHLEQAHLVGRAIRDMEVRSLSERPQGGPVVHTPLRLLIIGDSREARIEDFKAWFADSSKMHPHFTLFLDRGVVISIKPAFPETEKLGFYDHRHPGHWALFGPPKDSGYSRGLALLWLYYMVVAHLNWTVKGNMGTMLEFTNKVEKRYPLEVRSLLSQAAIW